MNPLAKLKKIKFNWRHLLLSFLAIWLIAHGCRLLGFLWNPDFADLLVHRQNIWDETTSTIAYALAYSEYTYLAGQFLTTIACIVVCRKVRWAFVNPLLALAMVIILEISMDGCWSVLKTIFLKPGSMFDNWLYCAVNGGVMLMLGVICIFIIGRIYPRRGGEAMLPYNVFPVSWNSH